MHEAGHPKPGFWDNSAGWGGEGRGRGFRIGGTHVYQWLIHADVWQKPSQYYKATFLQLKQINFKTRLRVSGVILRNLLTTNKLSRKF